MAHINFCSKKLKGSKDFTKSKMCNHLKFFRFIAVLILLGFKVIGQTNIQLIVKNTGGHTIDKISVFDMSGKEVYELKYKDTVNIHFSEMNIDCFNIHYFEKEKMFRQQVWLDTGNIKIESHIDFGKLIIDSVFNSPMFYSVRDFNKNYSSIYKQNDTALINEFLINAYKANIENPFSILIANLYIGLNQNSKVNLIKFKKTAEIQGDRFSWFAYYPVVYDRLNMILKVDKVSLNDFSFLNTANKKVELLLKGADYYVLDLWFLACPPCVAQHKEIKTYQRKLKQKRIELISISTDHDINELKKYLLKHRYIWKNYLQEGENTITEQLGISLFPTYIILDGSGKIIETFNSFAAIIKKFNLNE